MTISVISVAAIVVSLVVAVVQYAQWRTANQKVVIDLYDRRLKVYAQLEKTIAPVLREGQVSGDALKEFMIGQADARFLFGDDVQEYLKTLRKYFTWLVSFTDDVIDQRPDREQMIDLKYRYLGGVIAFFDEAPELFAPYMKLTQKNVQFWRPW